MIMITKEGSICLPTCVNLTEGKEEKPQQGKKEKPQQGKKEKPQQDKEDKKEDGMTCLSVSPGYYHHHHHNNRQHCLLFLPGYRIRTHRHQGLSFLLFQM
jgi:hypothetical protein